VKFPIDQSLKMALRRRLQIAGEFGLAPDGQARIADDLLMKAGIV